MTRDETTLAAIAARAGVTIVAPLTGGEFGATLVCDGSGRELVLKAMPPERWERAWARGAALANHLRSGGYPAPKYIATGAAHGVTWSLQERLAGEVPEVVSAVHMRQLLALADRHADAAPEPRDWLTGLMPWIEDSLQRILEEPRTRTLAEELEDVLARRDHVSVREGDVVHGDFHHRNFLAIGDEVTAVFDWEFASPGDWRYDLVTLAFWSALLRWQIPPAVAAMAVERMRERCPADVIALFAAMRAAEQVEFNLRNYPKQLTEFVEGVERWIAPWWRSRAQV